MGKNPLGNFEMLNKRPHVKDWNLKMESKIKCEKGISLSYITIYPVTT